MKNAEEFPPFFPVQLLAAGVWRQHIPPQSQIKQRRDRREITYHTYILKEMLPMMPHKKYYYVAALRDNNTQTAYYVGPHGHALLRDDDSNSNCIYQRQIEW
jgi:hypothetical protein